MVNNFFTFLIEFQLDVSKFPYIDYGTPTNPQQMLLIVIFALPK